MSTSTPASGLVRACLGVTLVVSFVTTVLPLAVHLWLRTLLATAQVVGAQLASTGGLEPMTFDSSLVLAFITLVVGTGLLVVRQSKRENDAPRRIWHRPIVVALLGFGFVAAVLVALDRTTIDVPDMLTTVPLLGVLLTVLLLGPLALVAMSFVALRWVWRDGCRSAASAMVVTFVGALLSIWGVERLRATPAADVVKLDGAGDPELVDAVESLDIRRDWADEGHRVMVVAAISADADVRRGVAGERGPDEPGDRIDQARFDACLIQLIVENEPNSEAAIGVRRARLSGVDGIAAEDVVYTTILDVCQRHARHERGIDNLGPYWGGALRRALAGYFERRQDRREAVSGMGDIPRCSAVPSGFDWLWFDVQAAFQRLTDRDREVLDLAVVGMLPREIAAELCISPNAASQRLSRARYRLRRAVGIETLANIGG